MSALDEAIDVLFAGDPDRFMDQRSILSKAARADGDAAAAKAIAALRRPTAAAAVVNRYIRADPPSVERLLQIGARLRQAHESLDAGELRELSTERRALVAELSRGALDDFGPDSPSAALREDVSNTFDAAVADPGIAARLGMLIRPERWSGFGVAPGSAPELTLVQGGRTSVRSSGRTSGRSSSHSPVRTGGRTTQEHEPAPPKPSSAERRRSDRALAKARDAFEAAENALHAAQQDEQDGAELVRSAGDQLADLSRQLDAAKRQLESSRRTLKSARVRRREARSALDRAERNAPSD